MSKVEGMTSVGLALSGGGSRAIAFHLGCLRALQDHGLLSRISVFSAVSGGSIIAAMYAYSVDDFRDFDGRVVKLLTRGLHKSILNNLLSPHLLVRIVATNLISRPAATASNLLGRQPPLRRWASRTDALEAALQDLFPSLQLGQIARPDVDVVFNACDLRTGSAFRFGNRRSGTWRFGKIKDNRISVAHAVACSAAYPMIFPAFDKFYTFVKDGVCRKQRVVITDGGVYDNLGLSCLEPGRDGKFSLHTFPVDYIICCYAGCGQLTGETIPYGFGSRTEAAFESIFRKVQDSALHRLHMYKQSGQIKGFVLPYLGQMDKMLPSPALDLVPREDVIGYPTNFAAMSEMDIGRISLRGEQLTRMLLSHYLPDL